MECPMNTSSNAVLDFIKSCTPYEINDDVLIHLSKECTVILEKILRKAENFRKHQGRHTLTPADFYIGIEMCHEMPLDNEKDDIKQNEITALPKISLNKTFLVRRSSSPSSGLPPQVSNELQVYFEKITTALLYSELSYLMAIKDLKTNKNLTPLIPYFVSFISSHINSETPDFSNINIVLESLQALLLNPHTYFLLKDLTQLVYLLLSCLLSSKCEQNFKIVKDKTAVLLKDILKLSKSKQLWIETLFVLESAFSNLSKSFITHYGALCAANLMGASAITLVVLPHVNVYFQHLEKIYVASANLSYYIAVEAELSHSHYILIMKELALVNNHRSQCPDILDLFNIVMPAKYTILQSFSKYFGDKLVPHFYPQTFITSVYKKTKIKK